MTDKTMTFDVHASVGETVIASGKAATLDGALELFKRGIEAWADEHGSLVDTAQAAAAAAAKAVFEDGAVT